MTKRIFPFSLFFPFFPMLFLLLCLAGMARADESPRPFDDSTIRRYITMPGVTGRTLYYYAQNDPIWNDTRYELSNRAGARRTFGGGGCNPTALAMVVANLVPEEALPLIDQHTKNDRPIAFCPGTVSGFFCKDHEEDEVLELEEPWEYKALLPLVFGHYSCYNNDQGRIFRSEAKKDGGGGTTYKLFDPIADMYGLTLSTTKSEDDVRTAIDNGSMVIALCGSSLQIFSEASGHFVVIGDYDQDAFYVLDTQVMEKYPKDKRHAIEFVQGEPGLLRIANENIYRMCVSYYFIFTNPAL